MWLCATFFCFYFLTKRECKSLQQTKEMKKMSNVQYLFFSHFLVKLASNERQIFFFFKVETDGPNIIINIIALHSGLDALSKNHKKA